MYRHDLLLDADSNQEDDEEKSIILNNKQVQRSNNAKKKIKIPELRVGLLDDSQQESTSHN